MSVPVETYNPNHERLDALALWFVWTLASTLVTGLLATGFSINDRPSGLMLLAIALLVGAFPMVRWRYNARGDQRLSVAEFPDELAMAMDSASTISRRLHTLARNALPGPVQDHLLVLAATANNEIRRTYETFETCTSEHIFVELAIENSSLVEDLTELENAATLLLVTQRDLVDVEVSEATHSPSRRIPTLTEQTQELQRQLADVATR